MTGIDKVKSQILSEAKAVAAAKVAEARQSAAETVAAAETDAAGLLAAAKEQSARETAAYTEKIVSAAALERRTRLLAAKQDIIQDIRGRAYEQLTTLPAPEYTQFLLGLVAGHVRPASGILYLSGRDRGRVESGFAAAAMAAAAKIGGRLQVQDGAENLEHGFVLSYGDTEENCTIKALFNDHEDEMKDRIHQLLFT